MIYIKRDDREAKRLRKELDWIKEQLKIEEDERYISPQKGKKLSKFKLDNISSDDESSEVAYEYDDYDQDNQNNSQTDLTYQNEAYWSLPLNVREAVDKAKLKNNKSEFYYKLKDLKFNIKRY